MRSLLKAAASLTVSTWLPAAANLDVCRIISDNLVTRFNEIASWGVSTQECDQEYVMSLPLFPIDMYGSHLAAFLFRSSLQVARLFSRT